MYLLNAEQILIHVNNPHGNYLKIVNFDYTMLQHSFYYFRLGADCEVMGREGSQIFRLSEERQYFTLEPHGYAVIKSHETFRLGNEVVGVFGQVSDFVRSGLELVHSPFIDPLFHGQLELGLWNRLSKVVKIRLGERIGKVAFFDISDAGPIRVIEGSIAESRFQKRIPLRDDDPVPSWVEEDDPQFED